LRKGFWWIAVGVILLDQWTKRLIQDHLPLESPPVQLFPGVYLNHVMNPGAAFGQFRGAGTLLAFAAFAAVLAILWYRRRLLQEGGQIHPLLAAGLALPLGGAVGNMIDRFRFGQVVDFIDLRWFPVFNIADSAITVGAALLATYFLVLQRPERDDRPEAADLRPPAVETAAEAD
jgi:signal peptidase II